MTTSVRPRARRGLFQFLAAIASGALLALTVGVAPANALDIGVISGTVTVDGVATAGILVQARPSGAGTSVNATTDALGHYEITAIPDGTWRVNVFDLTNPYQSISVPTVTISTATPTATRDLALLTWPTGTASVSGVITDTLTGMPVSGASVGFIGSGYARSTTMTTSADGAYAFTSLPAGSFSVSVSAPGYVHTQRSFAVLDGDLQTLDIAITAANSAIEGHVLDASSAPIAGVSVGVVLTTDSTVSSGTMTDALGYYSIPNLGAGTYTVSAGGLGGGWVQSSQSVVATASATATADFSLVHATTSMIGVWVHDSAMHSIAGICATAYDATSGVAVGGTPPGSSSVADGIVAIPDMVAGTYKLLFWDCDYTRNPAYATTFLGGASSLAHSATVTVVSGIAYNVSGGQVLGLGGSISGHINLQASGGVLEFPVSHTLYPTVFQLVDGAWEEFPNPSPFAGTGGIGDYHSLGLPAGSYRLGFIDPLTGPGAYQTEYWDDQAALADATNIVVTGGVDTPAHNATLGIIRPTIAPHALLDADLLPADENHIDTNASAVQGQQITLHVGSAFIGQFVSVWAHSTPALLGGGWLVVNAAGSVVVTIPTSLAAGPHKIAAQDAGGDLIGWAAIDIDPATGLAKTGTDLPPLLIPAALLLVLLGTALLLRTRRDRRA